MRFILKCKESPSCNLFHLKIITILIHNSTDIPHPRYIILYEVNTLFLFYKEEIRTTTQRNSESIYLYNYKNNICNLRLNSFLYTSIA